MSIPCNNLTYIDEKFLVGKKADEYLCLNLTSNRFFGGDWSGDYVQYFAINVMNKNQVEGNSFEIKKLISSQDIYISFFLSRILFYSKRYR